MSLEYFGGKTIVLLGPTASGKTEVAAVLAERIGGEIVSADAFQVYRGMNIATAKPPLDLRRRVPHHLIDILPVSESYNVARFRDLALALLPEIRGRGKVPLIVGGSAMYIAALVDGLCAAPSADHGLRDSLAAAEKEKGPGWLHERLCEVDPVSAGRIHPRNLKRIIRALEVHELTGGPISQLQKEWGNRTKDDRSPSSSSGADAGVSERFTMIGLRRERDDLYRRIDTRVEEMFRSGLVEETRRLQAEGADRAAGAGKALGYREVAGYLRGEYSGEEAKKRLAANTRHFARRQLIWWRRDERIRWIPVAAAERPEETADKIMQQNHLKFQITSAKLQTNPKSQ